jgi:phenylalanyl-tRNA synthetase alpha chain
MAEPYSVPKLEDYSSAAMDAAVRDLLSALEQEAAKLSGENEWKAFRDRWMSRKSGVLMQITEWLKTAPKEQKRDVGQRVNEVKSKIEAAVDVAEARVQSQASSARLITERIDVSLPGNRRP